MLALLCALVPGALAEEVSPQAAIGWRLFFDPLLSRPKTFSCATCHDPENAYGDGRERAEGVYGDVLARNTPRITNLRHSRSFFWDGRAASLEEQALVPLTHPQEMDLTVEEAVARVAGEAHYLEAFAATGVSEITIDDVLAAIAAFESTLTTGETRYDRWLRGDAAALDEAENRGRMIFFTRGQCATCHLGPALSDHELHNVGTGTAEDSGRFEVTGKEWDRGLFKTPPLYNWRGSEPFMHDGRFATVRAVVDHYSEPPPTMAGESELDPLELSAAEKEDLLAFLETLNGAWPDLSAHEAAWQALVR